MGKWEELKAIIELERNDWKQEPASATWVPVEGFYKKSSSAFYRLIKHQLFDSILQSLKFTVWKTIS